jgi:uncharacterized membrane protein YsdA (DUF1294 family)
MVAPDLTLILIWYLVIVNVMTLGVSGFDKLAAMHFWRRAPEWVLLGLSIIGGTPTAKIMQIVAGHKMLREDFTLNLNLIAVFHLALGVAIWAATSPLLQRLELYQIAQTASPEPKPDVPDVPRRFGPGS